MSSIRVEFAGADAAVTQLKSAVENYNQVVYKIQQTSFTFTDSFSKEIAKNGTNAQAQMVQLTTQHATDMGDFADACSRTVGSNGSVNDLDAEMGKMIAAHSAGI